MRYDDGRMWRLNEQMCGCLGGKINKTWFGMVWWVIEKRKSKGMSPGFLVCRTT